MTQPTILDEPQYGFQPHPRVRHEMPKRVRMTSALRASVFGTISCLLGVLIVIPFMFNSQVSSGQRWVMVAWCAVTASIALWGYFWNKYYAVLTYEVWDGGPKVQLAPGAHDYYIDPKWLKDAITTFSLMWNRNIRVKIDAGSILAGLTIRIVADPPSIGVPAEFVSDNKDVLASGRAIAFTDIDNLIITVWGARSQDLHGTLEYEFGHPLMSREGFAKDMAPGKEREEAWRRERIRLGLLDTKELRQNKKRK